MAQFPSDFSILDSTCTLLSYLDLNNISNQHQIQNMEEIDNDEVMEVPDTPDRLRGRRNSGEESSSPLMGDRPNEFSSSLMGDFENSNKSPRNHVRPSLRSGNSNKKSYSRHMGDSNLREQSNKADRTFISLLDSPTPSSVSANGHSRRTMGDQVFKVPAALMPSALPRDPRGNFNVLKFGGGTSDNAEVVASAHKYLGNEIMKNTMARSSTSCDTGSFTHSKTPMERRTCEDDNTDLDSIVRGDYAGMRQGAWSHGALKYHPVKDVKKGDMRSYSRETGADLDHKEDIVSSQSKADRKAINKNTGRRRLIPVHNGCISPSNTARSKHTSESHVSSSNCGQGEIKVISNGETLSGDIHSLASSSKGNQSVRMDKGKGKVVIIDPPREKEYKSKVIPGRSSISIKDDNGISNARECELKRPDEKDGWRSTRGRSNTTSSEMPGFLSPAQSSQQSFNAGPQSGPENETRGRLNKITKRQRKHSLLRSNLDECSTSDFDDLEITYIWSAGEPATSRSTRSRVPRHRSTSCPIVEVDESPEIRRGRPEDSSQMVDGDSDARLRQMEADEILARQLQEQLYDEMPGVGDGENDASLAWRLQQQEQPQCLSIGGQHRSTPRDSSMSHLHRQYTSQSFVDNSVLPANRHRGSLYTRTARLRNNHRRPQTVSSSRARHTRFPPTEDIDSRMHILEALEDLEAISERNPMTMASHFLQIQRDFNENDYEMLLALDDSNHQHVGASVNQINGLPQSTVQTENFEEACAICLETPTIGDAIRHLPCLHKFHKDCIDQWLRRSTSCPVCKCGINSEGSVS